MYPINRMTIYVTRSCNLKCKYCFVEHKEESLAYEIGKKSIDWLIHRASGEMENLSVGFFGGEPLMAFNTLGRLMEYGCQESLNNGKQIRFSMTTNGLLLNREKLSFLARFPIGMSISLDGMKETHDMFRQKKDGSGSFDELMEILPAFLKKIPDNIARVTINPETVGFLSDNIEFIIDVGFKHIALGFNSDVSWTFDDLEILDIELRKAANKYIERIMTNDPVEISFFNRSLDNLISQTPPLAACGAGKGFVNIAMNGDIFPCHHFTCLNGFEGAFKIGHIDSGIDSEARLPFLRNNAKKMLGCYTSCDKCKARIICGGGCFAKGFEKTGMLQMTDPLEQKFMLIIAEISEQIHQVLKKNRPPLFIEWCKKLAVEEFCDE